MVTVQKSLTDSAGDVCPAGKNQGLVPFSADRQEEQPNSIAKEEKINKKVH